MGYKLEGRFDSRWGHLNFSMA